MRAMSVSGGVDGRVRSVLNSQLVRRGLSTSGTKSDLRSRIDAATSAEDGLGSTASVGLASAMSDLKLLNKRETTTLTTLLKQEENFRSKVPVLIRKRTKKQKLYTSLGGQLFRSLHGSYRGSCTGAPVEYDSDRHRLTVTAEVLGKRRTLVYKNVDIVETNGDFEMTWMVGAETLINVETVNVSGSVVSDIRSFFFVYAGSHYRDDAPGLRKDVFSVIRGFGRSSETQMSVGDIGMFLVFCVHCYLWRSGEVSSYGDARGSSITLTDAWSSLQDAGLNSSKLFLLTRLARHAHGYYTRYGFVAPRKSRSPSGFNLSTSSREVKLHRNFCVDDIFAFFASNSGSLKSINSFHDLTVASHSFASDRLNDYIQYGRNMNSGEWTPFLLSARSGDLLTCKRSVKLGADLESHVNTGGTALMFSSTYGHVKIVEFLLSSGCNVDATNNRGRTALHFSARKGNEECAKVLVDFGASLTALTDEGKTAFEIATDRGHDFPFLEPPQNEL